jgi:hypothetical protein
MNIEIFTGIEEITIDNASIADLKNYLTKNKLPYGTTITLIINNEISIISICIDEVELDISEKGKFIIEKIYKESHFQCDCCNFSRDEIISIFDKCFKEEFNWMKNYNWLDSIDYYKKDKE